MIATKDLLAKVVVGTEFPVVLIQLWSTVTMGGGASFSEYTYWLS